MNFQAITTRILKNTRLRSGQSLSEYVIALALISLVALGALTLFAGNLANMAGNMLALITPNGGSNVAVNGETGAGGDGGGSNLEGLLSGDEAVMTLSDGTELFISDSDLDDLRSLVEVAGANGATGVLAAHIQQLADQLLEAGEITEAEANLLHDLANQGLRMAEIEALVEGAVAEAGSTEELLAMQLEFEGQLYTIDDLWQMITVSLDVHVRDMGSLLDYNDQAVGEMAVFLDKYDQVVSSGMLNDSEHAAYVESLSLQIAMLAEVLASATHDLQHADLGVDEFNDSIAHHLGDFESVSENTTDNSEKICTVGDGTTTNNNCS